MTVERRVSTDIGFGIRQLVDIALKVLAPSMNDHYTAVQAIQHLAIVMTGLATVATDDLWIAGEDGIRVFMPVPRFTLFLDTECTNIRRSASDRPRVLIALLRLLETVAASPTSVERRQAVTGRIELIVQEAEQRIEPAADLEPIRRMAHDAAFRSSLAD